MAKLKQNTYKIEKSLVNNSNKYKSLSRIFKGLRLTLMPLFPPLSLLLLYIGRRYQNKFRKEYELTDDFGKELKPIGDGHGDYKTGEGSDGIYFGMDEQNLPIHLSFSQMSQHGLILGTTGSGKTVTIFNMVRQVMRQGGGWMFVDGKAENPTYRQFYKMMRENGREDEMFLLSFRGSLEAHTNTWNPLLKGSSQKLNDMISELLFSGGGDGKNDVFKNRRKEFMKIALAVLVYKRDQKKQLITFNDVLTYTHKGRLLASLKKSKEELLNDPVTKDYEEFFIPNDYKEEGMSNNLKDAIKNFVSPLGVDIRTATVPEGSKIFSEQFGYITMQITPLLSDLIDSYGRIFNSPTSDIDFEDIVKNNRGIYVLLPRLEKPPETTARLGRLILRAVKEVISNSLGGITEGNVAVMERRERTGRARPNFFVMLDEYGSYAMNGFSDVVRQRRSLMISVWIAVQDLRSLNKNGDQEKKRLLGNLVSTMALKLQDQEAIDYIIKKRGKVQKLMDSNNSKETKLFGNNKDTDNLKEIDILKQRDFAEAKNGNGIFLFEEQAREFQSHFYEPEDIDEITLLELYPCEESYPTEEQVEFLLNRNVVDKKKVLKDD